MGGLRTSRQRAVVLMAATLVLGLAALSSEAFADPCGVSGQCNQLKVAVIDQPYNTNNDIFGLTSSCGATPLYSCSARFATTAGMTKLQKCEAIRNALAIGCAPKYVVSASCDNTDVNAPFFTATDTFTPTAVIGFQAVNEQNVLVGGTQGSTTLNDYETDLISTTGTTCPATDPNGDANPNDAITSQVVFSGTGNGQRISPGAGGDAEIVVNESSNGRGETTVTTASAGKTAHQLRDDLLVSLTVQGINASAVGTRGIRITKRAGDLHTIAVGANTDDFAIHLDSRMGALATLPVPTDDGRPAVPALSRFGAILLLALLGSAGTFLLWRRGH